MGLGDRSRSPVARRVVEAGLLVVAAVLVWRALHTWGGRIAAASIVIACSRLISIGAVVFAILLGFVILGWALRTTKRAVTDVRTGVANLRGESALRRRGQ